MKNLILIILAVILPITTIAQTYTGLSETVILQKLGAIDINNVFAPRAYISCGLTDTEEELFFCLIMPGYERFFDIDESCKVALEYYDGTKAITTIEYTSKNEHRIREGYNVCNLIAMFKVDMYKLCLSPLKKIAVQRCNGDVYDVAIKNTRAKKLCEEFKGMVKAARANAKKDKSKKESIKEYFNEPQQSQAPRVVDSHIKTLYNENYTLISVDTVAMPIRLLMSLDFATTIDMSRLNTEIKKIKSLTGRERITFTENLIHKMDSTYNSYISIEDIIAMRETEAPHQDNYYNYQRTTVYLQKSGYREEFYIRLGETSISMSRTEYDLKEEVVAENLKVYKKTIDKFKNMLEQMYYIEEHSY